MKRCGFPILAAALLVACGYLVLSAQSGSRAFAGQLPAAAQQTFAYTVTQHVISYTTPILITDLRSDQTTPAKYLDKESYNIRTLTVYRAEAGGQPLENQPVVFFVHGGAWTDGYAAWYTFVSQSFTGSKGWVTVVIDYRLTSDQVFLADAYCPDRVTCALPASVANRTKAAWYPDNIQDVGAAFAWVSQNIQNYGGDPNKIVIFGHSAGGHLASLLATHPDYASLRPQIRGVISMSGAYTLTNTASLAFFYNDMLQTFKGGPFNNPALQDASPGRYIAPGSNLPAIYLLNSESELPGLPLQTNLLTTTLETSGLPYKYDFLPGFDHQTEMEAIGDIQALPTSLIVKYIEDLLFKRTYLPFLVQIK